MLGTVGSTASASVFLPNDSSLRIQIAALPNISVSGNYQGGGTATLTYPGPTAVGVGANVFATAGLTVGTALLTGVPTLDNLTLTVANLAGTHNTGFSTANPIGGAALNPPPSGFPTPSAQLCPGGCLGGTQPLSGVVFLQLAGGGGAIPFPLGKAGVGGVTAVPLGTLGTLVGTLAPWITGKARITAITTNVVQLNGPTRGPITGLPVTLVPTPSETLMTFTTAGGFRTTVASPGPTSTVGTVTVHGSQLLASNASGNGLVTLISPFRIDASALGQPVIPGFWAQRLIFANVPEPGTMLLLVSGAAGLVLIGRKRMKR
jgi:hypothetical protein